LGEQCRWLKAQLALVQLPSPFMPDLVEWGLRRRHIKFGVRTCWSDGFDLEAHGSSLMARGSRQLAGVPALQRWIEGWRWQGARWWLKGPTGFVNWVTNLGRLIVFTWDTQVISPYVIVWWRTSLHMKDDMESSQNDPQGYFSILCLQNHCLLDGDQDE
jgi:hypothetical protein